MFGQTTLNFRDDCRVRDTKWIGDELYGVWTLAISFVEMFSRLDIGLIVAVGRYVAAKIGTKDYVGLNRYLNTGFYLFRGIGCIALFIAGAAAWHLFQSQDMPHANAVAVVIIIMGAQFAITLPLQAIAGLLVGALRFDIATAVRIATKILSSTAVFLTIYFGGEFLTFSDRVFGANDDVPTAGSRGFNDEPGK